MNSMLISLLVSGSLISESIGLQPPPPPLPLAPNSTLSRQYPPTQYQPIIQPQIISPQGSPPSSSSLYPQSYPGRGTGIIVNSPITVPTLQQFQNSFQVVPGTYEITVLHPHTCKPVCFKFCLPQGCPKVIFTKRAMTFNYPHCHQVRIVFRVCGKVDVYSH